MGEAGRDFFIEGHAMLHPRAVGREAHIVGERGLLQHLRAKPLPLAVVLHAEQQPLSIAGECRTVQSKTKKL